MAFADDLLTLSVRLANLDRENTRQATLGRAVSTAYYALFHLLVSETTLNWSQIEQRPALGRAFEHGRMKSVSEEKRAELKRAFDTASRPAPELAAHVHLYDVAGTFIEAQQKRHEADYNTAKEWSRTEVVILVGKVAAAFGRWSLIRAEPVAQAYLLSLLIGRSRRSE